MTALSESDRAWWVRPEEYVDDEDPRAGEKLHAIITHLERNQDRKRDLLLFGSMYSGGLPAGGLGTQADTYIRSSNSMGKGTLSLNVSRSVVDAVCARVFSKGRPHLSYVTDGGDYEKQDQAERLELGVEGVFYESGFDERAVTLGRDGTVFGTGILRIRPNWDERKVEMVRRMPWEYIIDDAEAMIGEPRSIYCAHYEDRGVVEHRTRIGWYARGDEPDLAPKAHLVHLVQASKDQDAEFGWQQVAIRVRLEEAWHRPSGVDAKDGRHVLCIPGMPLPLIDEPWDGGPGGRLEFANFRWCEPIVGFYGQGLVELGAGVQAEINKLVRQIQNGHHLITGKYLVEKMSKVTVAHINNDLSSILSYTGTPPQYVAPAIIAPEVYQHLWNLVQRYYALAGVNEQTAAAQKPAGLDSGEAQRVYADQQTETLLEKGKRFEEAVRVCGQLVTDAAKELARDGAYEVRAMSDDAFETVDWRELEDPDGFELKVQPTSMLPGTPSGKINLAQDMLKVGEYDPDDLLEIVGMPDTLQLNKRKLATRKLIEKIVGRMLRTGEPYEPTPFLQPLAQTAQLATQMLNEAECKGVEDDKLQVVRDFTVKVQALITKSAPTAPPPMMAPGATMAAPSMQTPGGPPPAAAPPVAA